MKKILAIRGHYQRGNEVIKILEMLGGVNSKNFNGTADRYFFFVCPYTNVIRANFEEDMLFADNWETHNLDSFKREYPYKTFDRFVLYGRGASICETFWNGFTIKYKIDNGLYLMEYSAEQLKSAINESKEESTKEKTDCEEKTTTISPLEIFANTYEGLEVLEKMGYSLDNMTCRELKKLLYYKIVG